MTDRDLGSLLERATERLPEPDLIDVAWAGALAYRRRRRRLVLAAVAAVSATAMATTMVVQLGGDADRQIRRPPAASTTPEPSQRAQTRTPDGSVVVTAPRAAEEAGLPVLLAGLPEEITLGQQAVNVSALTAQQKEAGMVAAYLHPQGDLFHPIVVFADGTHADIGLPLSRTTDAEGNPAWPFDRAGIAKGGTAIAFPQRGQVVIFTLRDGLVRRLAVPDRTIQRVGWTMSGTGLIASSDTSAWHIDVETGKSTKLVARAAPGPHSLSFVPGLGRLSTWNETGQLASEEPFGAPVRESSHNTFTSASGWAATAVSLVQGTPGLPSGAGQGLFTVRADDLVERRVLAFDESGERRSKGCCVPLGWRSDTLLYQSSSVQGSWILAWDLRTNLVSRVARLTSALPDESPTAVALAPG